MTWRYYRSLQDLQKFSNLRTDKKIFGIGIDEYKKANFAGDPEHQMMRITGMY